MLFSWSSRPQYSTGNRKFQKAGHSYGTTINFDTQRSAFKSCLNAGLITDMRAICQACQQN